MGYLHQAALEIDYYSVCPLVMGAAKEESAAPASKTAETAKPVAKASNKAPKATKSTKPTAKASKAQKSESAPTVGRNSRASTVLLNNIKPIAASPISQKGALMYCPSCPSVYIKGDRAYVSIDGLLNTIFALYKEHALNEERFNKFVALIENNPQKQRALKRLRSTRVEKVVYLDPFTGETSIQEQTLVSVKEFVAANKYNAFRSSAYLVDETIRTAYVEVDMFSVLSVNDSFILRLAFGEYIEMIYDFAQIYTKEHCFYSISGECEIRALVYHCSDYRKLLKRLLNIRKTLGFVPALPAMPKLCSPVEPEKKEAKASKPVAKTVKTIKTRKALERKAKLSAKKIKSYKEVNISLSTEEKSAKAA